MTFFSNEKQKKKNKKYSITTFLHEKKYNSISGAFYVRRIKKNLKKKKRTMILSQLE